jgi:hypothetical protein
MISTAGVAIVFSLEIIYPFARMESSSRMVGGLMLSAILFQIAASDYCFGVFNLPLTVPTGQFIL